MQAATGDPEADPEPQPAAEPPSMLWGLDPVFSAFARLYVKDILEMTESTQVPGVYFYNQHPIYKVDVLGIVVSRREREKFFCYGVDDSTGVISCVCWKSELLREEEDPTTVECSHNRSSAAFSSKNNIRKRPIPASAAGRMGPDRAADPVMALQIDWMLELPQLYRQCYDQPTPPRGDGRPAHSPLNRATALIKDFISQKSVVKFRPLDVLELLQPLVSSQPPPSDNQVTRPDRAADPVMALQIDWMLELPQLYRQHTADSPLNRATALIKDFISQKSVAKFRPLDVLELLQPLVSSQPPPADNQRFSLNVSRGALELVLSALELSSDIISTGGSHYTAV
ncbi:unnamed protein product [Menidia menidia]|uniref:CST complex subunit STN1 n=1 Tax=Menidia menidia TaxID=238744 RepID=A0A8S4AUQ6_9TELE|nr:unnamed protein product [Menidia menidia]